MAGVEIREAREDDDDAICDVLRRSIVELCEADHRNDVAHSAPNCNREWWTRA